MAVDIIGCEKEDRSSDVTHANADEGELKAEGVFVAVMPPDPTPTIDSDSDGMVYPRDDSSDFAPPVISPNPVILPNPVTLTATKVKAVMVQQAKTIKQQKKVVDKVEDDVQEIQQAMRQKRVLDLEALAKHRKWGDVAPKGNRDLYEEWRTARSKQMAAPPMAAP